MIDAASKTLEDVIIGKPEVSRQLISENNLIEVEGSRGELRVGRKGKLCAPDSVML